MRLCCFALEPITPNPCRCVHPQLPPMHHPTPPHPPPPTKGGPGAHTAPQPRGLLESKNRSRGGKNAANTAGLRRVRGGYARGCARTSARARVCLRARACVCVRARACVRTGAGTRVCVRVCARARSSPAGSAHRRVAAPRQVESRLPWKPHPAGGAGGAAGGGRSGGGGGGRCSAQRCAPGPRPPPGRAAPRRGTEAVGAERSGAERSCGRTWRRYRRVMSVRPSVFPIPPPPPSVPRYPFPTSSPSPIPLLRTFPGAPPRVSPLHTSPLHLSTPRPPSRSVSPISAFPGAPRSSGPSRVRIPPPPHSTPRAVPRPGARSPAAPHRSPPGPSRPREGERCGRCSGGGAAEEQRAVRPRGLCAFPPGSFME